MPAVINLTKLSRRNFADPVRAVVEAEVDGLTLRGLKLEWHGPNHWRLVPPGRKIQHQWQIIYDFSTQSVYDCLLKKVVQAYDGLSGQPKAPQQQIPVGNQLDDSGDGEEDFDPRASHAKNSRFKQSRRPRKGNYNQEQESSRKCLR